mmetsp:Transcript_33157/g.72289  ORF Transcript_33157/g.72289 Transcript_33157/m.72289 type:complete len:231 (+) Transcript_33157:404-1096(+)
MWSNATVKCNAVPAFSICSALLATREPTMRQPAKRAKTGATGFTAWHNRGTPALAETPRQVGASTSVTADLKIADAATGTVAPMRVLASTGVMKAAPNVVLAVISTESATSAPAMSVQRLDAEPPFTLLRSSTPITFSCDTCSSRPSERPRKGTREKQATKLMRTGLGLCRPFRKSAGCVVRPTENERSAIRRATGAPWSESKSAGKVSPSTAAKPIQRAKRLVKQKIAC